MATVAQGQSATVQPGESTSALVIVYDQATNLVSIKSLDAPLSAVLQQIAVKTRLTLTLPKQVLDERVSIELNRLPLEEALTRLLAGFNSALVYDGASTPRLAKVIVLSRKTGGSSEPRVQQSQPTQASRSPEQR